MAKTEPYYGRIMQLIRAYQTRELDEVSKAELDSWRLANPENQALFDELTSPRQLSRAVKEMSSFDAVTKFEEFEQKYSETSLKKHRLWWYKIGSAAAVIALLSFGIWLYDAYNTGNSQIQTAHQNDIEPGKRGATLTLADGTKIKLSDAANGTLSSEAGVTITKTADGQLQYVISDTDAGPANQGEKGAGMTNTLSTANGETYQVRLPDGTLVDLNAASSLTFPSSFAAVQKRLVKLQGEAYFSVTHDKSKPFIVKTDQQEIAVLGTEFNVNAYGDDDITITTLLKGSVQVNATDQVILKPGQQSSLSNGKLDVRTADVGSATGWKNGVFLFYDTDMKTIMRQLSRWYNIEINLSTVPDNRFYGEISRDVKLSEVLTMLEATGSIKFKLEGRRLMLLK